MLDILILCTHIKNIEDVLSSLADLILVDSSPLSILPRVVCLWILLKFFDIPTAGPKANGMQPEYCDNRSLLQSPAGTLPGSVQSSLACPSFDAFLSLTLINYASGKLLKTSYITPFTGHLALITSKYVLIHRSSGPESPSKDGH